MKKLVSLLMALALVLCAAAVSAETATISPLSVVYTTCALLLEDGSYVNNPDAEQKVDFQFYSDYTYVAINMGNGQKTTGTWAYTEGNEAMEIWFDENTSVIATVDEDRDLVIPIGEFSLVQRYFMRMPAGSFVTAAYLQDGEIITDLSNDMLMTFVMYDNWDFDVEFNGAIQSGTWSNTENGVAVTDASGFTSEIVLFEEGGYCMDTGAGWSVLFDFIPPTED